MKCFVMCSMASSAPKLSTSLQFMARGANTSLGTKVKVLHLYRLKIICSGEIINPDTVFDCAQMTGHDYCECKLSSAGLLGM
jgi:hypothetical protein